MEPYGIKVLPPNTPFQCFDYPLLFLIDYPSRCASTSGIGEDAILGDEVAGKDSLVMIFSSRLCGRDDNPRARFGVRPGMMVTKRNPQASTDVRQRRRVDIPDGPGKPDGALKRVRGRAQTSPFTARIQNGAVETGIMRGEKLHAGKPFAERRPQLPKCRGAGHVTPRDAVQIREHEVLAWRTNVVEGTIDDSPAFNSHDRDGTRAVAPVVRGLEVDRGKRRGSRQ